MRRTTKKRKHSAKLFSAAGESMSTEQTALPHKASLKRGNGLEHLQKVKDWTRLDWLQHRQKVSKNRRTGIDYGMSKLLTKKEVQRPLIKAILEDQAELPANDTKYNWIYILNFACAAGSENSTTYILKKLLAENKKALFEVLSDNTALCYAASSGNMSLCQKLMGEPYNCEVDYDVLRYATLSGNYDFGSKLRGYHQPQTHFKL